jgi:hypothetical protein
MKEPVSPAVVQALFDERLMREYDDELYGVVEASRMRLEAFNAWLDGEAEE